MPSFETRRSEMRCGENGSKGGAGLVAFQRPLLKETNSLSNYDGTEFYF